MGEALLLPHHYLLSVLACVHGLWAVFERVSEARCVRFSYLPFRAGLGHYAFGVLIPFAWGKGGGARRKGSKVNVIFGHRSGKGCDLGMPGGREAREEAHVLVPGGGHGLARDSHGSELEAHLIPCGDAEIPPWGVVVGEDVCQVSDPPSCPL